MPQVKKRIRKYIFSPGYDSEGHPYITVADNGKGIPDSIRDKIFIPFFSTKKNGNGIGLSISREIVKLHNGKAARAKPGERRKCLHYPIQ